MEEMGLERPSWMALDARLRVHSRTTGMGEVKGEEMTWRGYSQDFIGKGNSRRPEVNIDHLGKVFKAIRVASFQHKSKYSSTSVKKEQSG